MFKTWCEENEYTRLSKHVFGRDLRAACPSVRKERKRDGDKRRHAYLGIRWRTAADDKNEDAEGENEKSVRNRGQD